MELAFKLLTPAVLDQLEAIPDKNSRRYKNKLADIYGESPYVWKLSRYVKPYDGYMEFFPHAMKEHLNELHYTDVLDVLNTTKWFDSDYEPREGDYLVIHYQYNLSKTQLKYNLSNFLAFKYQSGQWTNDWYHDEILETIAEGLLCVKR